MDYLEHRVMKIKIIYCLLKDEIDAVWVKSEMLDEVLLHLVGGAGEVTAVCETLFLRQSY